MTAVEIPDLGELEEDLKLNMSALFIREIKYPNEKNQICCWKGVIYGRFETLMSCKKGSQPYVRKEIVTHR